MVEAVPSSGATIGAPTSAPTHFPGFDACRAIGMLLVLGVHTDFASFAQNKGIFHPLLVHMDVGVPIFFVLSAFLLYRPFVLGQLRDRPPVAARTFLRRRVLRVLPGYWFALGFVVLFLGADLRGWTGLVLYASLLFPFHPDYAFGGGIEVAWSLTAEFLFYAMLPVWAWALRRRCAGRSLTTQVRSAVVAALALYAAGQLFRVFLVVADPSWKRQAVIWYPNWVDMLGLGMAMAALSAGIAMGIGLPRAVQWLVDRPWACWTISLGLFWLVTRVQPPDQPGTIEWEYVFRFWMYGLVALFFLLPAMFGDQTTGRIRRFLQWRPLAALGSVSLGFYLVHKAFLAQAEEWLGAEPFQGDFVQLYLITAVCSIAFATASYLLVEKAFLAMKDRSIREVVGSWRHR